MLIHKFFGCEIEAMELKSCKNDDREMACLGCRIFLDISQLETKNLFFLPRSYPPCSICDLNQHSQMAF